MNRLMTLAASVLLGTLLAVPASADDPPKKLTAEERKELEANRKKLTESAAAAFQTGKYADGLKAFEEALEVARRLYPKADFPDGHIDLATSLNNASVGYQALDKMAAAMSAARDALEMRQRLFKGDHAHVVLSLINLANLYHLQGKLSAAEPLYKGALDMQRRLFKGDHPNLVNALIQLGALHRQQGQFAAAEPVYRELVEMHRRLFKDDHLAVAMNLNILGFVYQSQGKLSAAEPLYREATEMGKRLFKGDHPTVANYLNNLAAVYESQGKPAAAEELFKEVLGMNRRLFKGAHPDTATGLNNLGHLYEAQGKLAAAEPLLKEALDMRKRLFEGDHPEVAQSLNNLGHLCREQGKYADAERLYKDALDMQKRVVKGDHQFVATNMINLGLLYQSQGKYADAEPLHTDALEMGKRLMTVYARQKPEGEALTFLTSQPATRDSYLSLVRTRATDPKSSYDPGTAYRAVWSAKGSIARVYERRQLQARAATVGPVLTKALGELADARRRRAELLLAPKTTDPGTLEQRETELKAHDATIARVNAALSEQLPVAARADTLDAAALADLQKALPADAALVDFVRYTFFTWDDTRPAGEKEQRTWRYLAFVVARNKVAWIDLDTVANTEPAIDAWRGAITGGKEVPAAVPAKVRELVWEKVRKELPTGTKTVYICPDAALCRVPFAALPGDKPGTVLLEDFAIAIIPHAPFLLDKLWAQDKSTSAPSGVLVVGGVKYDADVAAPHAVSSAAPLIKPDAKLGWTFLVNTVGEANGIVAAAEQKKLAATRIEGEKATPSAVLSALPKAKYAHFATHGFFADASFRSVARLDPKDFAETRDGERIGRAANNPLVMTGLVFAGANNPKAPGRGIVTGEQLIDLDLSGLELAVLSACETGLGDVAGGEGTFGLQRAFHYAGTTNVVASLWKVPDESTAALMALFYANLWDKNLSPMESLRQAQLEIYKNPDKIQALAKGFRGKFEEVPGMGGEVEIKPSKDGKAHPLLWAAFTLSGPGK